MKKKILLTGAAGYIGSVLTKKLLEKGYVVTAIDNFYYNQTSLLDCTVHRNLNLVNGDVRDFKLINNLISKADIIIPLAALVGAPICNKYPLMSEEINHESSLNILEAQYHLFNALEMNDEASKTKKSIEFAKNKKKKRRQKINKFF